MFVHVVVLGQDVDQRQVVAVAVRVEHVREKHFRRILARAAKIHQDLVFGALAGVRRQTHALVGPVGVDALDEPDRADRDQVVRVVVVRVVFLDDVRHQPQVALNEHVARLQIALQPGVEIFALLGLAQRTRERAAGRSIRNALLIISIRVLYSIFSPPFLPVAILFGGCKYTCLPHNFPDVRKCYTTKR